MTQGLILTSPEERLDGIVFDPRIEYEREINVGIYTCPHCDGKVRFTTRDFQRHFQSRSSSFMPEDLASFDQFRPLDKKEGEQFLDFYCPGCRSPVRVIYRSSEFAMGSYYFTVVIVIEAAKT